MPPANIKDIYHQQGWNNDAAINADIAAGGWKNKVPQQSSNPSPSPSSSSNLDPGTLTSQANDLAAKQKAATDAEFANEKQAVSDFSNKYKGDVNNVVSNTSAKYNLPDLANISNALDSRIHELSGNTNNAGAGGMASASQVDQAVQSRYLPQYQQAVSNQANATQAAQTEENQLLAPDQAEASLLNQRLAQEMSGFTSEQKNELDGLLAAMEQGVSLTNAQQARAEDLAKAEEGFQNALNQVKLQQQNIVLPAGDTYYNTATGTTYNPYVASTTHG